MARKLVLCGLLVFVMPESVTQVAVGALLSTIASWVHIRLQPFADDDSANREQSIALCMIFLLLFSALLLKTNTATSEHYDMHTFTVLLCAINSTVFAVPLLQTLGQARPVISRLISRMRDEFRRVCMS